MCDRKQSERTTVIEPNVSLSSHRKCRASFNTFSHIQKAVKAHESTDGTDSRHLYVTFKSSSSSLPPTETFWKFLLNPNQHAACT